MGSAQNEEKVKTTFLYLFPALCWGLSYIAIDMTLEALHPFYGAALRVSIASLFFLSYLFFTKKRIKLTLKQLPKVFTLGVLHQSAPFALLFWGEQFVSPAFAGILIAAVPIFVVLFSLLINHEPEGRFTKAIGVVIGFLGIVVIFAPDGRGLRG